MSVGIYVYNRVSSTEFNYRGTLKKVLIYLLFIICCYNFMLKKCNKQSSSTILTLLDAVIWLRCTNKSTCSYCHSLF